MHSKCATHSFIAGDFTFFAGKGVKPVSLNLSWSLPLTLPQNRVSFRMLIVGMLTTNSFVSSIRLCECLRGEMLIATNGGLIDVGITHAKVIMFGFPFLPMQETRTVCIGCSSLEAEEGLTLTFSDMAITSNKHTRSLRFIGIFKHLLSFVMTFSCSGQFLLIGSAHKIQISRVLTRHSCHSSMNLQNFQTS